MGVKTVVVVVVISLERYNTLAPAVSPRHPTQLKPHTHTHTHTLREAENKESRNVLVGLCNGIERTCGKSFWLGSNTWTMYLSSASLLAFSSELAGRLAVVLNPVVAPPPGDNAIIRIPIITD
jgi:hypothetical protein